MQIITSATFMEARFKVILCSSVTWRLLFFPLGFIGHYGIECSIKACYKGVPILGDDSPMPRPPVLIPIGDPTHPRLGHAFHILQEPNAGVKCGPLGVSREEGTADMSLVTSPVNIIVTCLELGTMPAHPTPSFFSAACRAECLIDICIKCHKS